MFVRFLFRAAFCSSFQSAKCCFDKITFKSSICFRNFVTGGKHIVFFFVFVNFEYIYIYHEDRLDYHGRNLEHVDQASAVAVAGAAVAKIIEGFALEFGFECCQVLSRRQSYAHKGALSKCC